MNRIVTAALLLFASPAFASSCFNFADTYYQQVYCEIKASGKGSGLPSLLDFRRNDEQMQALLLKPYARRAGIELVMPRKSPAAVPVNKSFAAPTRLQSPVDCQLSAATIVCAKSRYDLVTNLPNSRLQAGVLEAGNAMDLPVFTGERGQAADVDAYLLRAYRRYLEQMIGIGLGGTTLSYGKFAYLFEDLNRRGLDFSQRFETMFRYLKADKKRLSVPVHSELPAGFDLSYCYALKPFLVCSWGLHNLVFAGPTVLNPQ